MSIIGRFAALAGVVAAVSLPIPSASAVAAEEAAAFPSKPITIVVPYPPGGSTDMLARLLGRKLSDNIGQPVIVENRAGASGTIGASHVVRSTPDGYTLFLGTSTALSVYPHLNKSIPYDPLKDLEPVVLATVLPSLVIVKDSLPVKSMKELTAYVLANPQETYASSSVGTPAHLGAEVYLKQVGAKLTHVPYKGGAPALVDLAGGHVSMMFAILPEVLPLVKEGRVRALAVTTKQRSVLFPDLPTLAETGVDGYELLGWYAFLAPKGTPAPIVGKLNALFNEALKDKEVSADLTKKGFEVAGGSAKQLGDTMAAESKKWGAVIAEVGIKAN